MLDEFSGLIGSKEKVGAALQADGETVYDKVRPRFKRYLLLSRSLSSD